MATFYVGKRPVLRGALNSERSNPFVAKRMVSAARSSVGVYSNYQLFAKGLLDGGPDRAYTPGSGNHPHDIAMTRRFRGLDTLNPMDNPGNGTRITGARYRPLEFKGLTTARALGSAGHAPRNLYYGVYNNFEFDGVAGAEVLKTPGHTRRSIGAAGTAATFGAFDPWINKGVTTTPLSGASGGYPTDFDSEYGRNRVNEWQGVPSGRVL